MDFKLLGPIERLRLIAKGNEIRQLIVTLDESTTNARNDLRIIHLKATVADELAVLVNVQQHDAIRCGREETAREPQ